MSDEPTQSVPAVIPLAEPEALTPATGTMLDTFRDPHRQMLHNLDLDELEDKAMGVNAFGIADATLTESTPKSFDLVKFVAYNIGETEKNGEILPPRAKVVLFDVNGKSLSFSSRVTAGFFSAIIAFFGTGPWKPFLPLLLIPHKGDKPGPWWELKVDTSRMPKSPKKGSKQ